jgi:ribonuclease HII
MKQMPTLSEEMALFAQGYSLIAGLDEAGRGCLAGPVVAAAVILPLAEDTLQRFAGVADSKQLTPRMRDQLYELIRQQALTVGVGIGSVEMIDEWNILQATKYAMRCALAQLSPAPQALLWTLCACPIFSFHSAISSKEMRVAFLLPRPRLSPK